MKKVISLFVIAALLCAVTALGACSGGKNTAAPIKGLSLTADQTSVASGKTVTVTLHAEDLEKVACFDVYVTWSDNAVLGEYKEGDVGELITTLSETEDGGLLFSGIVATTTDIASNDLATITFTVPENASSGDTVTIKAVSSQFLVGTDESGDTTEDVTDRIEIAPLTIKIK